MASRPVQVAVTAAAVVVPFGYAASGDAQRWADGGHIVAAGIGMSLRARKPICKRTTGPNWQESCVRKGADTSTPKTTAWMLKHAAATKGGTYTPETGAWTWIWSDLHLHHKKLLSRRSAKSAEYDLLVILSRCGRVRT